MLKLRILRSKTTRQTWSLSLVIQKVMFCSPYIQTIESIIQIYLINPMSFFKRIGTSRHKFKVQFFIKKVTLNKALTGKVYISIRRGDHKVNSQKEVPCQDKVCNFKNELLAFPAVTLFYDDEQHLYQEKTGEIKVIIKTDNDDKKLLGVVPFDLANYANTEDTKIFRQKKQLEQTPSHLKGHISFQLQLEHTGQGSETSKSLAKEDRNREESPFNKITNFFTGLTGSEKDRDSKRSENQGTGSPGISQAKSHKDVKQLRNKRTSRDAEDELFGKSKARSKASISRRQQQQQKKSNTNSHKNQQGQQDNITKKRKQVKDPLPVGEEELFASPVKKSKQKKQKKEPSQPEQQDIKKQKEQLFAQGSKQSKKPKIRPQQETPGGSDGQEDEQKGLFQQPISKQKRQPNSSKQQEISRKGHNGAGKDKNKPSKNLVSENYHDSLTQMSERQKEKSTISAKKSEPIEKAQFYFDDPATFPDDSKKIKKNKKQAFKNANKAEPTPNLQQQVPELNGENEDFFFDSPKSSKKIQENTIDINRKKQTKQDTTIRDPFSKQVVDVFQQKYPKDQKTSPLPKDEDKAFGSKTSKSKQAADALPKKPEEIFVGGSNASNKPPKQTGKQSKFSEKEYFEKVRQSESERKKNEELAKELSKLKNRLESKESQITQLSKKVEQLQNQKKSIQSSEGARQKSNQQSNQLKSQKAKLEKQVSQLKAQNAELKKEMNQQQSFFRQTQARYQDAGKDVELKDEIKRLQKEKNSYMLSLQKQQEKNKKQLQKQAQQLQKQSLKFKDYEDKSKAELKRLKDQLMSKNGTIDGLKDKMKERGKEQDTLIKENKQMNSANIELRQKLSGLKLKICDKLNQANEKGAFQIMEILTQLNEGL